MSTYTVLTEHTDCRRKMQIGLIRNCFFHFFKIRLLLQLDVIIAIIAPFFSMKLLSLSCYYRAIIHSSSKHDYHDNRGHVNDCYFISIWQHSLEDIYMKMSLLPSLPYLQLMQHFGKNHSRSSSYSSKDDGNGLF